jgi:hypothetical protein
MRIQRRAARTTSDDSLVHHIRSLVLCVDLSAPDGSGLLTLDASSIQTDPDRSRRIVWMIKSLREEIGWQGKLPIRPPQRLALQLSGLVYRP